MTYRLDTVDSHNWLHDLRKAKSTGTTKAVTTINVDMTSGPGSGHKCWGHPCKNPGHPKQQEEKTTSKQTKPAQQTTGYKTGLQLQQTNQRAFQGEPIATKTKLSKQDVGKLGENIIIQHLQSKGLADARPLNAKVSNFPVDLVQNHGAIEVKTGLVSNGTTAQHWRATIGQPGKAETAWLKSAGKEEKRAWNDAKSAQILDRKEAALKSLTKEFGRPVKGYTYTLIINPDTKTADVYAFKGFHLRIPWHSDTARKGYVGSYKYGKG